ncbi:hypothetical protein BH10PSE7_BH10PSE7_00440 [soil metagenome]
MLRTSGKGSGFLPENNDTVLTTQQREAAAYIADLAISLRNTAHNCGMPFLAHLLDMAFYEAYTAAHGVAPAVSGAQAKDTI